jgi:hypothetical protein
VSHRDAPTIKAKRAPVLLLVGVDDALAQRCQRAAAASGVAVASNAAESTLAMQSLPLAILFHERALGTSPIARVAREVGIEMRSATEELPDAALNALIDEMIRAARAPVARH